MLQGRWQEYGERKNHGGRSRRRVLADARRPSQTGGSPPGRAAGRARVPPAARSGERGKKARRHRRRIISTPAVDRATGPFRTFVHPRFFSRVSRVRIASARDAPSEENNNWCRKKISKKKISKKKTKILWFASAVCYVCVRYRCARVVLERRRLDRGAVFRFAVRASRTSGAKPPDTERSVIPRVYIFARCSWVISVRFIRHIFFFRGVLQLRVSGILDTAAPRRGSNCYYFRLYTVCKLMYVNFIESNLYCCFKRVWFIVICDSFYYVTENPCKAVKLIAFNFNLKNYIFAIIFENII